MVATWNMGQVAQHGWEITHRKKVLFVNLERIQWKDMQYILICKKKEQK